MRKYGLKIGVIYFSHFDVFARHANSRTPISYHAYARLNDFVLPIRGFTRIQRFPQGSLLLYRDSDKLQDVLNTSEIDFGRDDSNSHLVYGFSSPMTVDGSTICWVLRESRAMPIDKEKYRFFRDNKLIANNAPDAEITFLRDGTKSMKNIALRLYNVNSGESMTMVLNTNLFSYGDKGILIATVPLHEGWNSIRVPLDEHYLRRGLNKLSFWFQGKRPLASSKDGEAYSKQIQSKRLAQQLLGIAFDKMYFNMQ